MCEYLEHWDRDSLICQKKGVPKCEGCDIPRRRLTFIAVYRGDGGLSHLPCSECGRPAVASFMANGESLHLCDDCMDGFRPPKPLIEFVEGKRKALSEDLPF